MYHTDLRLGKLVYLFVFYNTSFSWLLSLNGFGFYFLLHDSAYTLLVRGVVSHLLCRPGYDILWLVKKIYTFACLDSSISKWTKHFRANMWYSVLPVQQSCHKILQLLQERTFTRENQASLYSWSKGC